MFSNVFEDLRCQLTFYDYFPCSIKIVNATDNLIIFKTFCQAALNFEHSKNESRNCQAKMENNVSKVSIRIKLLTKERIRLKNQTKKSIDDYIELGQKPSVVKAQKTK